MLLVGASGSEGWRGVHESGSPAQLQWSPRHQDAFIAARRPEPIYFVAPGRCGGEVTVSPLLGPILSSEPLEGRQDFKPFVFSFPSLCREIPREPAAKLRPDALLRLPPGPRGTRAISTRRGPGRRWPEGHCPLLAPGEGPALRCQPDIHIQVKGDAGVFGAG